MCGLGLRGRAAGWSQLECSLREQTNPGKPEQSLINSRLDTADFIRLALSLSLT